MTRVETIKGEIGKLTTGEFSELRDWILERDWKSWDREIERDAAGGLLDSVFEGALEAHPLSS